MRALAAVADIPETSISRFVKKERGINLAAASKLIEILPFYGNTYLSNTADVAKALENVTRNSKDLYVIGNQDTSLPMLEKFEDAIARGMGYQRLIQSGNITPELHSHLKNMSVYENSEIRQTDETLQDIVIGDASVLLPITAGSEAKAFQFGDDPNSRSGFLEYFKDVFGSSTQYSFGNDSIKPS